MELYPAVDVQGGRVARSARAEADPLALVAALARAGARWVHFVDLDRAYGRGENRALAQRLLAAAPVRVQAGGGLRTPEAVAELLDWGAARIVLGSAAAADAALVEQLLARHGGDRIAIGIEARDGRLAPRGGGGGGGGGASETVPELAPLELARRVQAQGARTVIYTDVARDGTFGGPDVEGARAIAALGLEVVVSGGVGSLDDLRQARAARLAGAIVGRALLEGRFTLAEALRCCA